MTTLSDAKAPTLKDKIEELEKIELARIKKEDKQKAKPKKLGKRSK